jgi:hypothetical protein
MRKHSGFWKGFACALALAAGLSADASADVYVSLSGTGSGTSWADATNSLQGAIDACTTGQTVWVADGLYDTGGRTNYPTGSTLTNRIAIWKAITVSSTNATPGATIVKGAWDPATNGPAAVRGVYLAAGAKLLGMVVTNGATLAYGGFAVNTRGGGVYCANNTSAIVSNCLIAGNMASATNYNSPGGGGAYQGLLLGCTIRGNGAYVGGGVSSSVLSNCLVIGNFTYIPVGGSSYPNGGGAANSTLYNCAVVGNRTDPTAGNADGGGTYGCSLYSCQVSNNVATRSGGGIYGGGPVYNCIVSSNRSNYGSGVISCPTVFNTLIANNYSAATYSIMERAAYNCGLVNCTIVSNRAAVSVNTGVGVGSSCTLTNCIVAFNVNSSGVTNNYESDTVFANSCTWPAKAGWAAGNVEAADPKFVNAAAGDYRLARFSPCIDAGVFFTWMTNTTGIRSRDLGGLTRFQNGAVDLGAYESAPPPSGTVVLIR